MRRFQQIVSAVRTIRAELNVPATAKVDVLVSAERAELAELVDEKRETLLELVGGSTVRVGTKIEAPHGSARQVVEDGEIYVPLADLIDVDSERARLAKELATVAGDLARTNSKLGNPTFLERAPQDVVEKEQAKLQEFLAKESRLKANLAGLS